MPPTASAIVNQGTETLTSLTEGMPILYAGNQITRVPAELAAAFRPGDRLVVVQTTGDLLHIPSADWTTARAAVDAAIQAFEHMGIVTDHAISRFYDEFARRLSDEASFEPIATANRTDVDRARRRGRSVTRLVLSEKMRADMIGGLYTWRDLPSRRGQVDERIEHRGWSVELRRAGLGAVGFVFEGRPNVFADATGVLRSGNTVVFRIGSDAIGTARAIVAQALDPALDAAGLPRGAVTLVDTASRAGGWALFSDDRLALAIARGSGPAVAQLGAVARQAGIPVSLHGTGGAWIVAGSSADPERFAAAVTNSLDHKVCNTLNSCCIPAGQTDRLVPAFLAALRAAAQRRGTNPKLHVVADQDHGVPAEWFEPVAITRAEGPIVEPGTEILSLDELGIEWEWEESPEVTLAIVGSVDEAVDLFNATSPQFAASLVSADPAEHQRFYDRINAPFVGNGFTRWVDGQYALDRPELGLSNWQLGRLWGRGGVLSGDSVFTLRTVAHQTDPDLAR